MRVGDSHAVIACLAAHHAALATHTDVTAKLEEVDTHIALLTAVWLFTKTPLQATMLKSPCVMYYHGDNAPFPEGFTYLCLEYMDSIDALDVPMLFTVGVGKSQGTLSGVGKGSLHKSLSIVIAARAGCGGCRLHGCCRGGSGAGDCHAAAWPGAQLTVAQEAAGAAAAPAQQVRGCATAPCPSVVLPCSGAVA